MMISLIIIAIACGLLLAFRFKVFVLIPTTLAVTAGIIICGLIAGRGISVTVLTVFALIPAIQIGYAVGRVLLDGVARVAAPSTVINNDQQPPAELSRR